jgi:hypothetical protein
VATVAVSQTYPASVDEAEACWCDISRWPEWVDGLARVVAVDPGWPGPDRAVIWESVPAGRGRVSERVTEYEPGAGLILAVEDDSIRGQERVVFQAVEAGVEVILSLEYRIRRRTPLTPLVERLFVRRPMALSLTKTLARFGPVLDGSRASGLG